MSKNVLITGATRGMGREVAFALAEQGMNLVIHYNSNKDAAEKLRNELAKYSISIHLAQANFAEGLTEISRLFDEAIAAFGHINALVNNAGVGYLTPINSITEKDFDLHFNVNVKAVYFLCQRAINHMKQGDKIINYSGGLVKILRSEVSCYIATKGAVEQLTRGLAFEAAEKGITINAVAPGAIDTVMSRKAMSEEDIADVSKHTAFGRLGKPEEIARYIRNMLSDDTNWCTGQVIHVNGGWV
jgi:3-oxoacyl-[acyl-carrier protein] reductase